MRAPRPARVISLRSKPATSVKPFCREAGRHACAPNEAAGCAPPCCSWPPCWAVQAPRGAGEWRGGSGRAMGPAVTSQRVASGSGGGGGGRGAEISSCPRFAAGWDPPATPRAACPQSWPTFKASMTRGWYSPCLPALSPLAHLQGGCMEHAFNWCAGCLSSSTLCPPALMRALLALLVCRLLRVQ